MRFWITSRDSFYPFCIISAALESNKNGRVQSNSCTQRLEDSIEDTLSLLPPSRLWVLVRPPLINIGLACNRKAGCHGIDGGLEFFFLGLAGSGHT